MTPQERPAQRDNPFARNKVDVRRNLAYKITDSYAIPRDQAISLIARHGNVEDVSDKDVQQWLDKIAADCIHKLTEGKPVPKSQPTPKKGNHVPSVGELCNDVCMDAGLLSSDATRAHREVLAALGHHKMPSEYKEWLVEWVAKQPKPIRNLLPPEPEMEKKPLSTSPFGDIPISPETQESLAKGYQETLNKLAEMDRQKQAAASVDLTPSPDVEDAFNNLEQAANNVASVAAQNTPISNGEAATSPETVSASAVEPEIENQTPTNAVDTSNVIEGEIVEDKKPEPTADEMIGKLRTEADKLIIATWPDLHSKDRIAERIVHLETAWKGCKGTHEAYAKYGYDVALKMVHDYCVERMLQPSALAKVAEQPTNITPITDAPSVRNFKMPSPEEFQMMQVFAKSVAASGLYKEINTFDKAFVILWKGFELGVGLGAALDGIYIINNRPWPGAQILKAVVMASGLAVRFDVVVDDYKAVATVQRKGMDVHVYTFTKDDAIHAGLWNNEKTAWPKHPKRMMVARVSRIAVVTDFPDLAAGIGIAIDGEDEDTIDAADVAEQKQLEPKVAA